LKIRYLIFVLSFFILPLASDSIANNTDKAEIFIANLGEKAISLLNDKSLSKEENIKQFKSILNEGFDIKLISRYALGRYWRRASEVEKVKYQILFEEFIITTYANRLSQFGGEKFIVKNSRKIEKNDYLVSSQIIPQKGPKIKVEWRVRNKEKNFKIIDVIIEGVSMVITQRDEFSSIIQRSGGNISELLIILEKNKNKK
jgi:ABC-type transport system involved in resistance to organic solvents, auxiliary component